MGRRRRRNYQRDNDIEFQTSELLVQSSSNPAPIQDIPLGPYMVSGLGRRNNSSRNPFCSNTNSNPRQPRNLFHSTGNPIQRQRTSPAFPQTEIDFRIGSSWFKKYLLRTINQTFHQIQLWYPDEDSVSNGEMDWQPEAEFIIPQPVEDIHYIWDPVPVPRQSDQNDEAGISPEVGRGLRIPLQTRIRVASDGNIELEAGRSPGGNSAEFGEWRSP